MSLKYRIEENRLSGPQVDDNGTIVADSYAICRNENMLSEEEFINALNLDGSTLTRTDVIAVIQLVKETGLKLAEQGDGFTFLFSTIKSSITGNFLGIDDRFDKSKHQVKIKASATKLIRDVAENISPEKEFVQETIPMILTIFDHITQEKNAIITPSSPITIEGLNLKITPSTENQISASLLFIAENGDITESPLIMENSPRKLIAMTPALPSGQYQVKVRTYEINNYEYKTPREGVFKSLVQVV